MDESINRFGGLGVYSKRGFEGRCPYATAPNVGDPSGHGFGRLVDVSQPTIGLEWFRCLATVGLGWQNPGLGPAPGLERSIQFVDRLGRGWIFDVILFWDRSKPGPTLPGRAIPKSEPQRFDA